MVTAEDSICPECTSKGKTNRIISVFYKAQEALYTCEDKMCTYFLTDIEGNLVKFNKETNKTSFILDRAPKCVNPDDDLNSFLDSLTTNYKKETNFTFPEQNAIQVQVPTSQPYENNLQLGNESLKNELKEHSADNFKIEELFNVNSSLINFDDLL